MVPASANVKQAIESLNSSGTKLLLVVDEQERLIGAVSDGDIRRGLLKGVNLDSPIAEVLHPDPMVVPPGVPDEAVSQIMLANKIEQIPIVDEQRRVVGLHLWSDLLVHPSRDNIMLIMAGGSGSRLRPYTETCPKPMLSVAGKPMLEHIIERAHAEGFGHFVISIQYLGHVIEDYFGDGARWNVRIDYLREETPLGTAGALSLLDPKPSLPFIVTNGDVVTDIRYGELLDFHIRHLAAATMAVRLHEWQHPFGVVQTEGVDIVGFEEKPIARTHINAGIYVLSPEALGYMPVNSRCDMPTLFEMVQAQGKRTIAYPMYEPWLDVGRPDDLARANRDNNSGPKNK